MKNDRFSMPSHCHEPRPPQPSRLSFVVQLGLWALVFFVGGVGLNVCLMAVSAGLSQ